MSRSWKWDVLKALRNQCETLDLSTTGNQAELDDRIKRKEEVTEITTTRSTPQYAAVEAIVAKKVVVKDVLEGELAYLEEETNRWGNEEELLQKDIHNSQTDNFSLKQRAIHLEAGVEKLNATVNILKVQSDHYLGCEKSIFLQS